MSSPPVPPPGANVRRDQYGFAIAAKPTRPKAVAGALMLVVGGGAHIIGVFLTWYSGSGVDSLKGLDTFAGPQGVGDLPNPGLFWLVIGGVLVVLGTITYFAGRIFAVAVIAVFVAIGALFDAILGFGAVKNQRFIAEGDVGPGVIIGTVAALVAIAGSIQVLAKRRR